MELTSDLISDNNINDYYTKYIQYIQMRSTLDLISDNTIFKILSSSHFEKINNISNLLVKLVDEYDKELNKLCRFSSVCRNESTFPIIIVCGDASSGKTSLIEKMTKCKFFPRNIEKPIHLMTRYGDENIVISGSSRLSSHIYNINKKDIKKDILDEVNHLSESNCDTITIVVTDKKLPNLNLCILPGIPLYDNDPKILKIYEHYFKKKNATILCTVPATIPNILGSKTVQLIKNMNVQNNCIMVLTMVDMLHPYSIETNVIRRILKKDSEITNLNFSSCVAVINEFCKHSNKLKKNDNRERKWFDDNVIGHMTGHEKDVKKNVTTQMLLQTISILYEKNIKNYYKEKLDDLSRKKNDLDAFLKLINKQSITKDELKILLLNGIKSTKTSCVTFDMPKLNIDTSSRINSYWTLRSLIQIYIERAVAKFFKYFNYYLIKDIFDRPYAISIDHNINCYPKDCHIGKRFKSVTDEIKKNIGEHFDTLKNKYLEEIMTTTIQHLNNLYITEQNIDSNDIKNKIKDMITLFFLHNLFEYLDSYVWSDIMYYEDKKYSDMRKNVTQLVADIDSCLNELKKLDQ